jgi:hypothetical protein
MWTCAAHLRYIRNQMSAAVSSYRIHADLNCEIVSDQLTCHNSIRPSGR